MAIKVSGITVINDNRELTNLNSMSGVIATDSDIRGAAISSDKLITISGFNTANYYTDIDSTGSANITLDLKAGINYRFILRKNLTLTNPINYAGMNGKSGFIEAIQDSTGSHTLSYETDWLFSPGTPPDLADSARASDLFGYQVQDSAMIISRIISLSNRLPA